MVKLLGKGVITGMENQISSSQKKSIKSSSLKTSGKMYFFDVYLAANNKKYLKVTESRFVKEGEERIRNSIVLFPEEVQSFQQRLGELSTDLN